MSKLEQCWFVGARSHETGVSEGGLWRPSKPTSTTSGGQYTTPVTVGCEPLRIRTMEREIVKSKFLKKLPVSAGLPGRIKNFRDLAFLTLYPTLPY
jgi:hypothetical protein